MSSRGRQPHEEEGPRDDLPDVPHAASPARSPPYHERPGRGPAAGEWSATEVLGHLLDAEVTLGFRIRKLAAEPGGTIVAWDQEKWTVGLRHQRGDARTLFAGYA